MEECAVDKKTIEENSSEKNVAGNKVYKGYITGLKGIACLLIMVGHFLGLYRYAEAFEPHINILDKIYNSKFEFIISEAYWLYLFFIVSGYLVAKSKIQSFSEFLKKSIMRFLRFGIPIFFAYCVIFGLYKFVGFYNKETIMLFQCNWFQSSYNGIYTIKDVLKGPIDVLIFNKFEFCGQYWVLRNMFIASIVIYILKYIINVFKDSDKINFIVLLGILITSLFITPIITGILMGMIISIYENKLLNFSKKSFFAVLILFITCIMYIWPKELISAIFFGALLCFIPKIPIVCKILSSKIIEFIGKISWGIYSLHWAIMCSIGSIIMLKLYMHVGNIKAYIISFLSCMLITVILSIFYYFTFEKLAGIITGFIGKLLYKKSSLK